MNRFTIFAVGLVGLGLAGCAQGTPSGLSDAGATISASAATPKNFAPASSDHMQGVDARKHHAGQAPYHASDNLLTDAKQNFREGRFGLAEKSYRKAVELSPRDAEAWIGLAASYDRMRRFDLADRAYDQAIRLVGRTPMMLNNLGYSQLLRGDLRKARKYFLAAYEAEPDSDIIRNNLELLNESGKRIVREKA